MIKKTYVAFENGNLANLKFGAGRPLKPSMLTDEIIDDIIRKETLRSQAGMTLPKRADVFNAANNLPVGYQLNGRDIRDFYRGAKITYQKNAV